jgi:hypothetical protein
LKIFIAKMLFFIVFSGNIDGKIFNELIFNVNSTELLVRADKSIKLLAFLSYNWSVKIYLDTKFDVHVLIC